ncbi:tyrosine-type recombinase/integrase [Micromonospora sp. NPDC093244]|uniref:tyrosine-type recombinase/integrase n=1 Tax=Micromonospora sp. NPDC093244 TaxID=3155071 RepID=UPI0034140938
MPPLTLRLGQGLSGWRTGVRSDRPGIRRRRQGCGSIGLVGLTPHELRHTAASLAVAEDANVKAVQRMLGHASAAMTLDVYADLFEDDLDQVADRLDRAAGRAAADSVRTEGVGPDLDAVRPDRRQHA